MNANKKDPKFSSRANLMSEVMQDKKKRGSKPDLSPEPFHENIFEFIGEHGIEDSLRLKNSSPEYASVKVKVEIYDKIRRSAASRGIRQPGKVINLILQKYLEFCDLQAKSKTEDR